MAGQRYDIDLVRSAASRRWPEILSTVAGIPSELLDGKHHPCPKCGGTDRFRLMDSAAGAVLCNQCFNQRNGDGFAAIQFFRGYSFGQALESVAALVGVEPEKTKGGSSKVADPAEHLEFLRDNPVLLSMWCRKKSPITPEAIQRCGGRIAKYRGQWTVLALPVYGPNLRFSAPVGWIIYDIAGRMLPKWDKNGKPDWVKVKLTAGSQRGLVGPVHEIATATTIWKTEGPSDLLSFFSLADIPEGTTAVTNANGAMEFSPWMVGLLNGKSVRVIHDADTPGNTGAGKILLAAKQHANDIHQVILPYPISGNHGKDLRDYLKEGHTYQDLLRLSEQSLTRQSGPKSIEAEDDPHRLARINLEKYSTATSGGTIRYYQEEWFTWKPDRGHYRKIGERELRAKVAEVIKAEFDRLSIEKQQTGAEDLTARKVSTTLISNVLMATASISVIPSSAEPGSWIDQAERKREKRNYVALKNGILDIDALLANADQDQCLLPHSPNWFSTICLPYKFDPDAKCPRWDAFLEKNLEGDQERINLLQEWAGYCLLPDTGEQKFMVLEGEGANGKSVYCAALQAILGKDNISHIPLEQFGMRFQLTETLGKLLNVAADTGEIEKAAEGFLKSFTSGDSMYFERKGISGLSSAPTARLLLACNNRPRFSDRSSGIWRRMILVPFRVQISKGERTKNMDKIWWWEQGGELPGIFNWALVGLARLKEQNGFTHSEVCESALEDYKIESNPAKAFLTEHLQESMMATTKTSTIYRLYCYWCEQKGYRPMNDRHFGREVTRTFKGTERVKSGPRGNRYWAYKGIEFSTEEIEGRKVNDEPMF